ncbi:DUF456 domain-containing protein [uncultured Alistipes sp.]|uniref:DUF456 domain-containing protein n=1 Tax=uncultured Alistipes sp. TaxID=538949 RepID=UPI00260A226F|nr:DUF456 domain-containing protein [uncultured Alistipes sp.]
MDVFLSILAFVCCLVGIAGCIIPVLPGPVLSYAGLFCAYACSYSSIAPSSMWIWAAVTLVVVLVDYFLPGYLAKLFGGTRAGTIGATVGMFAGLFVGGFIGVVLGPFVGAVIGELMHDRSNTAHAFRVGVGSFLSFLVGTGLKLVAAGAMFALVIADTWPAVKAWCVGLFAS